MKLKSLFFTRKFIISTIINIIFLFLIGMSFASKINTSIYSYKTWDNCESSYIAYDTREFDNNCYYYYGNKVHFKISTGDSIVINADVYQFIDNKKYDNRSLVNEKNVIDGNYKILKDNEIAIPKSISKKYDLQIGQYIYLKDSAYEIIYIFRNIYDIKNPSIDSIKNAIFIGGNSNVNNEYLYAYFGSESEIYNEVYTFNNAKTEFLNTLYIFTGATCVLVALLQLFIIFLFKKSEIKNLYKDCISGSKKNYYKSLFGVNMMLHLLPSLISSILLLLCKNYISAIVVCFISVLIVVIKITYLRLKIH